MLLFRKQDEGAEGGAGGQIKQGQKKEHGVATPGGGQKAGMGSHTGRRARGG